MLTCDEVLFLVKLRSLHWIKVVDDNNLFLESLWWTNPLACSSCATSKSIRLSRVWSPPSSGFLKFNVDGSVRGNPDIAGVWGVLRNENGSISAIFSSPVGVAEPCVTELKAVCTALKVFDKTLWKRSTALIVELDSKCVVDWCNNKLTRPWKLWDIFQIFDACVNLIGKVSIVHTYREANGFADALAKVGVDRPHLFQAWWLSVWLRSAHLFSCAYSLVLPMLELCFGVVTLFPSCNSFGLFTACFMYWC
ncbi:hypothetical protein REPUB_Repub10bG0020100 [Reevesia pubescens]